MTGEPLVSIEGKPFAPAPWLPARSLLGELLSVARRGRRIYAIGAVLVDVTEQRRAADEIRAASSSRSFWSRAGARPRNPLNAITLTTEGLLRKGERLIR